MALYYDLPVFKDVYQMTLRIFQVTTNFPREYKFTLGQDLKRDCILLVRYLYRANKTKDKTVYLEQFLDSFEVVKLELRLCKDLHLTTVKQQSEFAVFMNSIGNRLLPGVMPVAINKCTCVYWSCCQKPSNNNNARELNFNNGNMR